MEHTGAAQVAEGGAPRRLFVALALPLLLLAPGCAHRVAAAPLAPQAQQKGRFHTVAPGETLYRIATEHGVPVETLARENDLDDPAQLAAGRVLFIPATHAPAGPAGTFGLGDRSGGGSATLQAAPPAEGPQRAALLWPVRGVIFSPFGPRGAEHHDGLDLAAPEGTPVVAAADGTVVFAGEQRGYGRIILVAHDGDLVTVYAHNHDNLVQPGDRVVRGQQIATVGRSGNATGPHLHFEVRVHTKARDPISWLRR